jgi:hypothetical protein
MGQTDVRPLIQEATTSGVLLWVAGGELHFKAEKGKLTNSLRSALRSKKGDLIGELTVPVFEKRIAAPAVVRCAADRIGFWKECEKDTGLRQGTNYAVKVIGPNALERIRAALRYLTSRHDLLCSRVRIADDGVPEILLGDDPSPPVALVDLSGTAAADAPSALEAAVERAIYAPFEDGRIYRAQIIKISDSEYVVTVVIHHFLVDALAVQVVVNDLMLGLQSSPDALPALVRPLQYADYLSGMNEWLAGPGLPYRLGLWKEKMRGAPGVTFPPADDSQRADSCRLDLINLHAGKELRAKLARAVAASGVPFSIAILAANFAALASTFKQRDFFTVVLYSGRDDPALFDMVGSTIGSIPVRVTVDPQMSFADLLVRVHEAFVFAVAYRVPWGALKPSFAEIGAGPAAPFFNYRSFTRSAGAPAPDAQADTVRVEPVAVGRPAQTDIVDWKAYEIRAVDTGAELHLELGYMRSNYSTPAIRSFAQTLSRCLEAMANHPTSRVGF